jgi:hypothetical protein
MQLVRLIFKYLSRTFGRAFLCSPIFTAKEGYLPLSAYFNSYHTQNLSIIREVTLNFINVV